MPLRKRSLYLRNGNIEIRFSCFILPYIISAITGNKENTWYIISVMPILLESQNKQNSYETGYLSQRIFKYAVET